MNRKLAFLLHKEIPHSDQQANQEHGVLHDVH